MKAVLLNVLLVVIIVAITPVVLIAGLQLMGAPIELTWKTFFGALLVCAALQGTSR